ncbi:neprilysin-2-like [Stegodyphus dumicola]|uniref:neprilysin-2-like n=1 Tax=Stegodyphus dumicola TaxID=202533 RepID=UPI0015AFC359|nr:neprilysin-2-like [Stegodyphus dumicola]
MCTVTAINIIVILACASVLKANSDSRKVTDLSVNPDTLPRIDSRTDVCQSDECQKAADSISKSLNKAVNPCVDFYQFTCGGWIKKNDVSPAVPYVSAFSKVQDHLNLELKRILKILTYASPPDYIAKLKRLFFWCMNTEDKSQWERDYEDGKSLKRILEDLGGWPAVEGGNWSQSAFNWMDTLVKFRKIGYGHNVIMKLTVEEDPENRTANILKLEPSLGIDVRDARSFIQKNLKLMEAVTEAFNFPSNDELEKSLYLAVQLARVAFQCNNDKVPYERYTVAKLIKIAPKIDWIRYFREIVGYDIGENEPILVTNVNFFRRLGTHLEKSNKRALANYMIWKFIEESLSIMEDSWKNLQNPPYKTRLEDCLTSLRSYAGLALSAYYLQNHLEEEKNQIEDDLHVKNIFTPILQAFEGSLEESSWMDSTTKMKAKKKARSIKARTGYKAELLNDTYLSDMYSDFHITYRTYFDNMREIRLWKTNYSFLQLRKRNIKNDWKKYDKAPAIKPYYNYLENIIEFPAGNLRHGFFKKDLPNYLNFGTFGYLIGHEILRAFDEKGRQIDENGNKVQWWPLKENADRKLKLKISCAKKEYFDFIKKPDLWNDPKIKIFETQDEYIGYISGLKAAYEGYKIWSSEKKQEEPKLPGLKYTPKQLFWISAAQLWCEKAEESYSEKQFSIKTSYPHQYKAIASVLNIPEFAEDFGCAPRQTQCQIQ